MAQPKTGKNNKLSGVVGNTGANVVSSDKNTGKQTIMHKTTGEKPADPGFAKASPNFKTVQPDEKVVASEDAQRKALEENVIEEGLNEDDGDDSDQS